MRKDSVEYRALDVAEGLRAFVSGTDSGGDDEPVQLRVKHLRTAAEAIEQLLDVRTIDHLVCPNCRAPIAIALDTMGHGLLAGWTCGNCQKLSMLSDIAATSEAIRREEPKVPCPRCGHLAVPGSVCYVTMPPPTDQEKARE